MGRFLLFFWRDFLPSYLPLFLSNLSNMATQLVLLSSREQARIFKKNSHYKKGVSLLSEPKPAHVNLPSYLHPLMLAISSSSTSLGWWIFTMLLPKWRKSLKHPGNGFIPVVLLCTRQARNRAGHFLLIITSSVSPPCLSWVRKVGSALSAGAKVLMRRKCSSMDPGLSCSAIKRDNMMCTSLFLLQRSNGFECACFLGYFSIKQ